MNPTTADLVDHARAAAPAVALALLHEPFYQAITCDCGDGALAVLTDYIEYSLREAQIIIENWRREFNTIRPHSSLGYRPPTPETLQPADPACAVWKLQPDRPSAGAPLSVA